jgi:hypothetical protein
MMTIPSRPTVVLTKRFPGTAQQFRAQMQRLIYRCEEIFGTEIRFDKRLRDLALERGSLYGLWKSSDDDLLGFREIRQLESILEQLHGEYQDEPISRRDITPLTRSTWSIFMFRRKKRVSTEGELPIPRPDVVSHISRSGITSSGQYETVEEYIEYTEKEMGFGCIEVYEQHNGSRIDFKDACNPIASMDGNLPLADLPIGKPFVEFCEWVVQEIWDEIQIVKLRIHIEEIASFSRVSLISPGDVVDCLVDGRLELLEDEIQERIEKILGIPFHKLDWGGEENDLYTANVFMGKERITSAFALKGKGLRTKKLEIGDCGKNGDQLVRLCQSPAELFVVQYIGEISENVIKDIEGKVRVLRSQGKRAWYCIIDGQDTARLLKAYGYL